MDVIAINGSPRKTMNTSTLLNAAIQEIETSGKTVQSYNLYDLTYKGCYSCFACKKTAEPSYGKCAIGDDLKPIFEKIKECSALILATPIYYRDVTGQMRSFIERLLFQSMLYSTPPRSIFGKKIKVGLIYTMNVTEKQYQNYLLKPHLEGMEETIRLVLGETFSFFGFETNQLKDYTGIEYTFIDSRQRMKRHDEHFPKEIERVREFAKKLL